MSVKLSDMKEGATIFMIDFVGIDYDTDTNFHNLVGFNVQPVVITTMSPIVQDRTLKFYGTVLNEQSHPTKKEVVFQIRLTSDYVPDFYTTREEARSMADFFTSLLDHK
jgi:CO dehydrogenase nickel-insertion accessory protein CooC1